jgi:transposase
MNKVVETFSNYITGVVNTLIMNLGNAMAERLIGEIQELKIVAKGYRTLANFRSVMLLSMVV